MWTSERNHVLLSYEESEHTHEYEFLNIPTSCSDMNLWTYPHPALMWISERSHVLLWHESLNVATSCCDVLCESLCDVKMLWFVKRVIQFSRLVYCVSIAVFLVSCRFMKGHLSEWVITGCTLHGLTSLTRCHAVFYLISGFDNEFHIILDYFWENAVCFLLVLSHEFTVVHWMLIDFVLMPVTGSNDLSTNNSILITRGTILRFFAAQGRHVAPVDVKLSMIHIDLSTPDFSASVQGRCMTLWSQNLLFFESFECQCPKEAYLLSMLLVVFFFVTPVLKKQLCLDKIVILRLYSFSLYVYFVRDSFVTFSFYILYRFVYRDSFCRSCAISDAEQRMVSIWKIIYLPADHNCNI